jgi:hypothetical protein
MDKGCPTLIITRSQQQPDMNHLVCKNLIQMSILQIIAKDNPYVLGIRDTESVEEFQKKIVHARRVVVVGNGGIATEIV